MIPLARITPLVFSENGRPVFGGTAWCYRNNRIFVTAAHCLTDPDPAAPDPQLTSAHVHLGDAQKSEFIACDRLIRHPNLDVAVLRTQQPTAFEPFSRLHEAAYAESCYVCGFAADGGVGAFTPRIMSGIVQRFFTHEYGRYPALELSMSTPQGMSGAPVFSTRDVDSVLGIVVGNNEAETLIESYEDETPAGRVVRRHVKVTTFGVALRADAVRDFLTTTADDLLA